MTSDAVRQTALNQYSRAVRCQTRAMFFDPLTVEEVDVQAKAALSRLGVLAPDQDVEHFQQNRRPLRISLLFGDFIPSEDVTVADLEAKVKNLLNSEIE